MNKLEERILELNLPRLPESREEILQLLQERMYGFTPPACPVEAKVISTQNMAYGGKAEERKLEIILRAPGGTHSFPVTFVTPKARPVTAVFVHIAFMREDGDGNKFSLSCPVEEIIDNGFAIAIFDFLDIASDDGDLTKGIAPLFPREGDAAWGKLGMWAYGMSRVADYTSTLPEFENAPLAAVGYSRLGKTSLWCGAQDTRFKYVLPLGSSTAGVGLTRQNCKQNIEELLEKHWFWFNKTFQSYNHNEDAMPFDQHFAVAACAPRYLLTSFGLNDEWADAEKEYISCLAASPAYVRAGVTGFSGPADAVPAKPVAYMDGALAMNVHNGTHYLSRLDWHAAMSFIKNKEAVS